MVEIVMIHAFEKAGLGKAPFHYVGTYDLPAPSLAEQNPTAYMNALRMTPSGFHCGTCSFCGRAIMINCLIKSADGKSFAVGTECVLKVGGAGMVKMMRRSPEYRKKAAEQRERADARVKQQWAEIWACPEKVEALATFTVGTWKGGTEPWTTLAQRAWGMCGAAGRKRYLKTAQKLLAEKAKKAE